MLYEVMVSAIRVRRVDSQLFVGGSLVPFRLPGDPNVTSRLTRHRRAGEPPPVTGQHQSSRRPATLNY